MRNTHAVCPVTDASDKSDVAMDEPADPDGLGGEVTEGHDVSHVPYRPWCRFCVPPDTQWRTRR